MDNNEKLSKLKMTLPEAEDLFPEIEVFYKEHKREPQINSSESSEVKLAEVLAYLRKYEAERK